MTVEDQYLKVPDVNPDTSPQPSDQVLGVTGGKVVLFRLGDLPATGSGLPPIGNYGGVIVSGGGTLWMLVDVPSLSGPNTFPGDQTVGGPFPGSVRLIVQTIGSGPFGSEGLTLLNTGAGTSAVFNVLPGGSLYITDVAGAGIPLSIGRFENPADGSTMTLGFGFWYLTGGAGCQWWVNRIPFANYQSFIRVNSPSWPGQAIQAAAGQTADLHQWLDNSLSILSRVMAGGNFATRSAEPASADLVAGEVALWIDPTNGAASLNFKAKQLDGTVKTFSAPLT